MENVLVFINTTYYCLYYLYFNIISSCTKSLNFLYVSAWVKIFQREILFFAFFYKTIIILSLRVEFFITTFQIQCTKNQYIFFNLSNFYTFFFFLTTHKMTSVYILISIPCNNFNHRKQQWPTQLMSEITFRIQ